MKTRVVRTKDKRYVVLYRRHWWASEMVVTKRFLSRKNAESYAMRLIWKFKHPRKYRKMLQTLGKQYFTGG